jgi:uncharacterized paraquat-inducible protein A
VSSGPGPSSAESTKNTGDIIRAIHNYAFISCSCGLRIKIPPEFKHDKLSCPRCKRIHIVPKVDDKTLGAILATTAAMSSKSSPVIKTIQGNEYQQIEKAPQIVKRISGQWQQIICAVCDHSHDISPRFKGSKIICNTCHNLISITSPDNSSSQN